MKEKILKGRNMKRLLSVILTLAMVFALIPLNSMTVYAESTTYTINISVNGWTGEVSFDAGNATSAVEGDTIKIYFDFYNLKEDFCIKKIGGADATGWNNQIDTKKTDEWIEYVIPTGYKVKSFSGEIGVDPYWGTIEGYLGINLEEYSSITTISNPIAVTGIDSPVKGTALDTAGACATTGIATTTPAVTWKVGDVVKTGIAAASTAYTAYVTLEATSGYKFSDTPTATINGKEASVTRTDDTHITVSYSFDETAARQYAISKAATENGSFTVSASSATEGTQISVTVIPTEGYEVDSVKYNDGSDHVITDSNGYKFTMPASDVTVTVDFKRTSSEPDVNSVIEKAVINGTAEVGNTLTVDITWVSEEKPVLFQWYREGEAIEGARSNSYTLTEEDKNKRISVKLRCEGYTGELSVSIEGSVSGKIETVVKNEAGVSATVSDDILKKAVKTESLTQEEQNRINSGETLKIELEIKNNDSISDVSKGKIDDKLKEDTKTKEKDNVKVEKYLDISMFKYFVGDEANKTAITNTSEPVEITLTVPDDIYDAAKSYAVAKNHNGEVSIIGTYNPNTRKISFSSSEFSDYAIISWITDEGNKEEEPKQEDKKEGIQKQKKNETEETVYVDRDLCKSELGTGSVLVSYDNTLASLTDFKAHSLDKNTNANQELMAKSHSAVIGKNLGIKNPTAKILWSYGIYPRRDLSLKENGSLQILKVKLSTLKNAPKAGTYVYAQCYSPKDGIYLLIGLVGKDGYAVFNNYILRDAVNVTIFAVE